MFLMIPCFVKKSRKLHLHQVGRVAVKCTNQPLHHHLLHPLFIITIKDIIVFIVLIISTNTDSTNINTNTDRLMVTQMTSLQQRLRLIRVQRICITVNIPVSQIQILYYTNTHTLQMIMHVRNGIIEFNNIFRKTQTLTYIFR